MSQFRPLLESEIEAVTKKLLRERRGQRGRRPSAVEQFLDDPHQAQVLIQEDDPFTTVALQVGDEVFLGASKRTTYAGRPIKGAELLFDSGPQGESTLDVRLVRDAVPADKYDPQIGVTIALTRAAARLAQ